MVPLLFKLPSDLLFELVPSLWCTENVRDDIVKLAYWASFAPNLSFFLFFLPSSSSFNFVLKGVRIRAKEKGIGTEANSVAKTTKTATPNCVLNYVQKDCNALSIANEHCSRVEG